jgi:hypothetical protein
MKFGKSFSRLTVRRLLFGPLAKASLAFSPRARAPSFGPARPPRPSPHHTHRLPPARADAADRVRRPAPRGGRMAVTPAGWRPVAPTSARTRRFKLAASPCPSNSPPIRLSPPRAQQLQLRLRHRAPSPAMPVPATPPYQRVHSPGVLSDFYR